MALYKKSDIEHYRKHLDDAYQEVIAILDAEPVSKELYLSYIKNNLNDNTSNFRELNDIKVLQEACDRLLLATKHLKGLKNKRISIH